MSLKYDYELIPKAKELRKDMTPHERKLWYMFLRNYQVRFRRQKTIDHFIVDFYCHKANLVIEIDGSQHYSEEGKVYDDERTAVLESYGLKVLRFSNADIDSNFCGVCEAIDLAVKDKNALEYFSEE